MEENVLRFPRLAVLARGLLLTSICVMAIAPILGLSFGLFGDPSWTVIFSIIEGLALLAAVYFLLRILKDRVLLGETEVTWTRLFHKPITYAYARINKAALVHNGGRLCFLLLFDDGRKLCFDASKDALLFLRGKVDVDVID